MDNDGDERAAQLYRLVGLGPPEYRRTEVAAAAGIPRERSVSWWRALGFPEVPEDVPAFTATDVEIVRRLAQTSNAGVLDDGEILRLARLLGASFSRIADAQIEVVEEIATSSGQELVDALNGQWLDLLQ